MAIETFLHFFCLAIMLAGAFIQSRQSGVRIFKLNTIHYSVWVAIFAFTFITVISVAFAKISNVGLNTEQAEMLKSYPEFSVFSFFVLTVIYAPIIEELYFRGVILNFLSKKLNVTIAVTISTALWTLLHFDFNIITIFELLISGGILSFIAIKMQSIHVCIILHVCNNLAAWYLN